MITPYACQLAPQMTRDHESSDWKQYTKGQDTFQWYVFQRAGYDLGNMLRANGHSIVLSKPAHCALLKRLPSLFLQLSCC